MLHRLIPNNPIWNMIFDVLLAGSIVFVAAFFSYTVFSSKQDVERPRIINRIWIEPTVISPGGSFKVHINDTMSQICPGETHWSIVRTADNVEVARTIQPTQPTHLGDNDIVVTRSVPTTAVPGNYYYVVTVYDFCGPNRTTYTAVTPHIPFVIR